MTRGLAATGWAALGAGVMGLALIATGLVHLGGAPNGDDDTAAQAQASADTPTLDDEGVLHLTPAQVAHAAVRSTKLVAGSAPSLRHGFARVLDLSPLATIEADLATARAALASSRAQAERLAGLAAQDQSASRQAVEAARAQAAADAARVSLAERQVGLDFGPGLARLDEPARRALIADAAAGRAALLRIDMPGAPLRTGLTVDVADGNHDASVRVIGPAASADPQLQDAAMLAILRGPMAPGARAGRQFTASAAAQTGTQAGVIVPRVALIRWQGQLWVYLDAGHGAFRRVPLEAARPVSGGWLVTQGLKPGDAVVTDGAATLFAIERGGAAVQEDD